MSEPRLLGRVGRNSGRHPIITIAVWVVLLGVAVATAIFGVGGQTLFDRLDSGGNWSNGESATADDLLAGGSDDDRHAARPRRRPARCPDRLDHHRAGRRSGEDRRTSPWSIRCLAPPLPDGSIDPRVAPLFADDGRRGPLPGDREGGCDGNVPQDTVDQIVTRMDSATDDIRSAHTDAVAEVGSTGSCS